MGTNYKVDLTGQRFGRLVAVRHEITQGRKTFWLCRCDCGKDVLVGYGDLKSENTKSCGCLRREKSADCLRDKSTIHGMFGTRLYHIWDGMKARCENKKHIAYKNYGGRGITICDEWRNSFEAFYDWAMSHGYQENLTIDRIDNNGNYCPENCRWATTKEQASNKRNNHRITINGQTKTVSEWSKETGLSKDLIRYRVKAGWPVEKLFIEPTKTKNKVEKKHVL